MKVMETVKFTVITCGSDMCRIVPHDIRSKFKEIAGEGCICSLDVMLSAMEDITRKCKEIGVTALFEI